MLSEKEITQFNEIAKQNGYTVTKVQTKIKELKPKEFVTGFVEKEGKNGLLKVLNTDDLYVLKNFLTEVWFLQFVSKLPFSHHVTLLLDAQIDHPPFWYVRDFVEMEKSGPHEINLGFESDFLTHIEPDHLVTFQKNLWELGLENEVRLHVPITKKPYLPEYSVSMLGWHQAFLGEGLHSMVVRYLHDRDNMLRKSMLALTHNDCNNDNLLYDKNERTYKVIDWEFTGYDYPLIDAAFIYLQAWKNKIWQQEFRTRALEAFTTFSSGVTGTPMGEIVKEYWNAVIIFNATHLLNFNRPLLKEDNEFPLTSGIKEELELFLNWIRGELSHIR